ncbi:MAG TPA: hypothetical protein VHS31_14955 [Tepidisphaeraceae bacterium]|nr:hypothetical protein [Tepidisphaeraceae bacterium]
MKRLLLVLFILFPLSTLAAPATTQSTQFLRYLDMPDGSSRLEVAEATYKNDKGVVVHLIGAVHIADADFFAGLNESFDHYDALLYEMVKPREAAEQNRLPTATERKGSSLAWVGNMQRFMRDHLHLTYQLDAIDYDRPNFVHADLDMQTFAQLQAERNESMFSLMVRSAMHNLAKGGDDSDVKSLALLGALMSPNSSQEIKRALAQQFADLDDMMDGMEGPNGSVIVGERNKVALRVLQEQIAKGKKYLGIFYGAGHLRLMEKSLDEMGFHKVGVTWRTAWYIGPPAPVPTTQKTTP